MFNLTLTAKVKVEEDSHYVPVDGVDGLLQTLPKDVKTVLEDYFEGFEIIIEEVEITNE
jgi:hypothetical protein|tara:strand:- start:2144 stop:2320 length:177 start_codon:yes stop_codon:yes gene_type:complete